MVCSPSATARRLNIWLRSRRRLAEYGPRLGLKLRGELAVLQAPMFDDLSLDSLALLDDGAGPAGVGVGGVTLFMCGAAEGFRRSAGSVEWLRRAGRSLRRPAPCPACRSQIERKRLRRNPLLGVPNRLGIDTPLICGERTGGCVRSTLSTPACIAITPSLSRNASMTAPKPPMP